MDQLPISWTTQNRSDGVELSAMFESFRSIAIKVGQVFDALVQAAAAEMEQAERKHHRGQLRAAYQERRRWKKSDRVPLATLNVNEPAQRRMARLSGTGRPVVRPYEPLLQKIVRKAAAIQALGKEDSSPEERRKAFREWPWFEYYVEAMYRGEHLRAKDQGRREASRFAEAEVADALRMSPSRVHQICCKIRRIPAEDNGFPPITLCDFEAWMRTGKNPRL